jgi:hypothetical protein
MIKNSQTALFFVLLSAIAPLCLTQDTPACTLVRLRINTRHGIENAKGAVLDAGLELDSEISVTASSPFNGIPFLTPDKFVEDAKEAGALILSSSFSSWNFTYDTDGYEQLTANGMVHVFAYEPRQPQPWNAPPPAAFVTVNMSGGKSGGGIEFGVPRTYMQGKGGSNTPSGVTAQLAGLMACLKYSHPVWNWFDIKAALRATATNYANGYNPAESGYGVIDYPAANRIRDAAKLPLFAPAAVVLRQRGDQLVFAINAFKQSRRFTETLFAFADRPAPQTRDLTLTEITAMGGQQLYSNYDEQVNTYAYRLSSADTPYFVWFTQDASGIFSRIEPYSIIGPVSQSR